MNDSAVKESVVVCKNSQGAELRATPLRLTRYLAVFEIYTPTAALRTSEVLGEFKIVWNDRTLYSGRAIVSNLVNSGAVTVCEATLDDS